MEEESNCKLTANYVRSLAQDNEILYIPNSKYGLLILQLDEKLDCQIFGEKEIHDNIYRTVEWINIDTFLKEDFYDKLHIRLRSDNIFEFIKNK